jgi:hypothetical protein
MNIPRYAEATAGDRIGEMNEIRDRLHRWVRLDQQPAPLPLDHPAQEDLSVAQITFGIWGSRMSGGARTGNVHPVPVIHNEVLRTRVSFPHTGAVAAQRAAAHTAILYFPYLSSIWEVSDERISAVVALIRLARALDPIG